VPPCLVVNTVSPNLNCVQFGSLVVEYVCMLVVPDGKFAYVNVVFKLKAFAFLACL
jgi:hypothetical protein